MTRPKILIIYTGGTIGMIEDPTTHALRPFDFSHLIENVPKVKMLDYSIDNYQFKNPIDSSNMNFEHWRDIASIIERNYNLYDGFVVLHGTDTMAYTASALTFMLENLDKPVIITGSQLPIGEVRTDGEENLITALQIAASRRPDGRSTVREVAILFEDYLWRGCRATKRSADNFNAFQSNNYPALAHVGLDIDYDYEALAHKETTGSLKVNYGMDPNVIELTLNPGLNASFLNHALNAPGLKGVILRSYGAGNAPDTEWFNKALSEAIERGIVILNVTQCVHGPVRAGRYLAGEKLLDMGVISGHDITFEAAITKMMHLFGQNIPIEEVRQKLTRPMAGEMTIR
ncbi:MAG: asparaginase [Muribaculaceae bacterium]|nr:asparaginase [Muribaculaceae bacterium]